MMSKRATKAAAKQAAYEEAMKSQPKAPKGKWTFHIWDEKTDSLRTRSIPGFFPRPSADWHREGSLDEIEQRKNAGQREMF
jgi:hypothetical protein